MAAKKTFSDRLTNRYLLIIRNEENFAEKTTFSFTYAKIVLLSVAVFLVMLALAVWIVTGVLDQWLDPRQVQLRANRQQAQISKTLDSLNLEISKRDAYIANVKTIFAGEDMAYAKDVDRELTDEQFAAQQASDAGPDLPIDFRKEFDESSTFSLEQYEVASDLREIFLFNPVSEDSRLASKFDPKINHYGVDLVAKKDEPVKAVGDGTVIFADWTIENGNVLAIQHRSNLISVYKHNSELLKKAGNFVSQGEIISIIGNTGELTTGPHLHFELWFNGSPVDPAEFIDF